MSLFRLCSYGKDKHIAKGFTQNVCYMLLKSNVKLFAKAGRQRAKQSIEARQHPSYPSILLAKCQKTSRWRTISMQCYCTSVIKPMRVASHPTQSQGFAARNCEPAIYLKSYFMAFISSNSGKNKKYTISLPMENTIFHFTPQLKQNCN